MSPDSLDYFRSLISFRQLKGTNFPSLAFLSLVLPQTVNIISISFTSATIIL